MQPATCRAFRHFFKKHFTVVSILAPYHRLQTLYSRKYSSTLSQTTNTLHSPVLNIKMLVNIHPFRIK
jgi:hypothetical protein